MGEHVRIATVGKLGIVINLIFLCVERRVAYPFWVWVLMTVRGSKSGELKKLWTLISGIVPINQAASGHYPGFHHGLLRRSIDIRLCDSGDNTGRD